MTVFKTFLHVLNKCKGTIIIYTVMLVFFGGINMRTSDNNMGFTESKPDILIVNNDTETGVTADMIKYLKEHTELVGIEDNEEARNDALFYRDVNYIIYIPEHFREDLLAAKNPEIEIKSTGDYPSNYAEMLLTKYIKTAQSYIDISADENELIENVSSTLKLETEIEITSKLDTTKLVKTAFFFNFMNYGLLAGAIFTICTVLAAFNEKNVRKRTISSCISVKKYNRILLMSNFLFAAALWILYVILAFILCGSKTMTSKHGLMFTLNSFAFMICTVTIAFLIANIITNKNALNGIINVIALGSSFLCGAFVPAEYLPKSVLNIAHILPSYWYIKTNDSLTTLEKWNSDTLKPLFINIGIIFVFSAVFVILSNVVSARKRNDN